MEELDNYSIETDHTVLLSFRNGRQRRVKVDRLPHYLRPQDLHIVQEAMKLRQDFIRSHMPRAVVLFIAAGLLTLLAISSRPLVARLLGHPDAPGGTRIVRSQIPHQSGAQPAPTSPAATPLITRSGPGTNPGIKLAAHHVAATNVIPDPAPAAVSQPAVLPSAAPSPSPAATPVTSPQISPAATPTSTGQPVSSPAPAVQQGQVLGDSTGPSTP